MSIYKNKNLLALKGKLFKFPTVLINYIADVFGYGWDRNRAIDSKGAHGNALMGGYLLTVSNTTITISGLLTTDTIVPLTSGGNVGTVAANDTISFSLGLKYGAFEVYRGTARIGRYCLTERQGLQIINQITGGLPNGLLGGTTTTVWQRSNAFYCETNHTGYSISGTGWVTSAGVALTDGTIVTTDPLNPTKCMAWVGGVQQDLQFIGKAKNSVSVIPYAHFFSQDRNYRLPPWGGTVTNHYMRVHCKINSTVTDQFVYGGGFTPDFTHSRCIYVTGLTNLRVSYYQKYATIGISAYISTPLIIEAGYTNGLVWIRVTESTTGKSVYGSTQYTVGSITIASAGYTRLGGIETVPQYLAGSISYAEESANGVYTYKVVPSQHSANVYNLVAKTTTAISGISTNLHQNTDCVCNVYNSVGYEIWTNGTDYQIYPLASDGTRIITPAGYSLVETVTAGDMPSVADSRMSMFKYALANSYEVKQSVPDAFDATDPCAPKLLTYSELSALTNNIKVIKTEADEKITNLTIRQ